MDTVDIIDKSCGVGMLLAGIYGLLVAFRIFKPRWIVDPERLERFRKQSKILGPILTVGGILWILGILRT
jgi:hypothetical protein